MSTTHHDPRIARGMQTQLKLRQDRLASGERLIGWKVGFGAPASMARLGIDAPLVGFLTDRALLQSEATLSVSGWTKPAAEPEIAVYLGDDLPHAAEREAARAAIAAVGPAIELADVSFPAEAVEAILAGNIYNRHVILGRRDPSRAGCALDGLTGRVYRNDREVAAITNLQAHTGDLVDVVGHVANVLAALGERLRAGQVIITGSILPPLWVDSEEDIRFHLESIDSVSVSLTPAPGAGRETRSFADASMPGFVQHARRRVSQTE